MMCLTFQAALQDSQIELETYKQTRQGLDEMYNVVWKQYKEEKRIRQVGYQQTLVWEYIMYGAGEILYWVRGFCLCDEAQTSQTEASSVSSEYFLDRLDSRTKFDSWHFEYSCDA